MKKKDKMTHKEAVRTALELLGGKAHLKQIYPVAIKLIGDNTHSVDIRATIRRELNSSPLDFKATPDAEGWWELISYQEEVSSLKEIIEQVVAMPKTNDFMRDFLKEVMHVYKHDRIKADLLRIVLRNLGFEDEALVLDAWIEEKEDAVKNALLKIAEKAGGKRQIGLLTISDKEIKQAILNLLSAKDENDKLIFKNKKQWWAVFRVLATYCNYPLQMTAFITKMNNLELGDIDEKRKYTYDSLCAATKEVPFIATSKPSTWDAMKDKSDNYMQQYVVADFLMQKLGIKS
jgi:hypothetical protein